MHQGTAYTTRQSHVMRRRLRFSIGACVLGVAVGCAAGSLERDASYKMVPIDDVGMVVGEWEGLVKKNHGALSEGSVRLMIRANSTYLFAGQSASNVAVGSGTLEARGGRLVGEAEKRAVRLTLYDHKGKAVLLVESTNHETGDHVNGQFTKAR